MDESHGRTSPQDSIPVTDTFEPCRVPWRVWPWGLDLSHSDTDVVPECSVEFGARVLHDGRDYGELWVVVEFELAGFASAKPHRDDEELADVSGYEIPVRRREYSESMRQAEEEAWLSTGICPEPHFYFSTDSTWLRSERESWAYRQRGRIEPGDAIHFVLNGRDGYVEVIAAGYAWRAWRTGHPRLNDVSGDPILSDRWPDR